jgi:putative spermidine/putrescine transport system ATP-binding protein
MTIAEQSRLQTDPHVSFKGVSKAYDETVLAVRELNLDVKRGEFLTLLGPSGSGKTTALMLLAGFEYPSAGEILIDGRRIDAVPANRRGIGMVFQNYALFPHMTVAENLAFPLEVRRRPRAEITDRVNHVLELVRLPGLGGRRPDQLSGGQQQRIAVARALIFEPTLVLMDEPLGALDKQLRERMQFEIKEIHGRLGVTFIYVTHDQTEALTMSDRIAVFNAGAIQQLSTPAMLYERPRTSFVASFIGENNRIEGTVSTLDGNAATVTLMGGRTVHATAENPVAHGKPVLLSVRPERVSILAEGQSMPGELDATVTAVIYVGDHSRVVLAAPQFSQFVVKVASGKGFGSLSAGSKVRIGWRAEDCLALDL